MMHVCLEVRPTPYITLLTASGNEHVLQVAERLLRENLDHGVKHFVPHGVFFG